MSGITIDCAERIDRNDRMTRRKKGHKESRRKKASEE
jgi:hypothetical protein